MLSGKLEAPILDADAALCVGGLIDSHADPVIGDYTPRQHQLHWIDPTRHRGVATMI